MHAARAGRNGHRPGPPGPGGTAAYDAAVLLRPTATSLNRSIRDRNAGALLRLLLREAMGRKPDDELDGPVRSLTTRQMRRGESVLGDAARYRSPALLGVFVLALIVVLLVGIFATGHADIARSGGVNLNLWGGAAMLLSTFFTVWIRLRPPRTG